MNYLVAGPNIGLEIAGLGIQYELYDSVWLIAYGL